MSDAQSILLILLFFYFIECLKWAALGSVSFTVWAVFKPFARIQKPTVDFFGAKKRLFLAPIIPAFKLQLITDKTHEAGHLSSAIKTVSGLRRRLFYLRVRTLPLRTLSVLIFATYFIFLPALYLNFGLGSFLYSAVGLGYFLQFVCAIFYFRAHRYFFPEQLGVRILHTFYNIILPWHAMRASDEFFIKSSAQWSELAILGATASSDQINHRLALYWREAQFLKAPSYSVATLKQIFDEINIPVDSAMALVVPEKEGRTYCPCCGVVYGNAVRHCLDCGKLGLKKT
jgi:hypothetical protein